MIHWIFRACTKHSMKFTAKVILEKNQYSEPLVDSIIRDTLNKLFEKEKAALPEENEDGWNEWKYFSSNTGERYLTNLNKILES